MNGFSCRPPDCRVAAAAAVVGLGPPPLRPSQASRKARLRSAGAASAAADAAPRSRSTATGEGRLIGATGLVPCAAEHAKSRAPSVRLFKRSEFSVGLNKYWARNYYLLWVA